MGGCPVVGLFSSHSLPLPFGTGATADGAFWELLSAICKLLNQLRNGRPRLLARVWQE